jgi:hypothetical protein
MATTPTTTTPTAAAPRATDRFFLAILAGLGLLLVVALLSVLLLRQPAAVLPVDTPEGVVQRFYLALEERDYHRAYDLLGAQATAPLTRDEFVRYNADRQRYEGSQRVRIDDQRINGDFATVTATVTHYAANAQPFGVGGEYSEAETFSLQRDANGWRISGLPYRYRPYPYPK